MSQFRQNATALHSHEPEGFAAAASTFREFGMLPAWV